MCSCAVLFGASSPLIAHAGHIALDVTVQSSHRFYLFRLIHANSTRISHPLNSPSREYHGIIALSCWVDLLVTDYRCLGPGCGCVVGVLQNAGGGCASGLVGFGVFCASLLLGFQQLRASGLSLHIHALLALLASPIFHSVCPVVADDQDYCLLSLQ